MISDNPSPYTLNNPVHKGTLLNERYASWRKVESKLICPECGEEYKEEARVEAGMKCGRCAYQE